MAHSTADWKVGDWVVRTVEHSVARRAWTMVVKWASLKVELRAAQLAALWAVRRAVNWVVYWVARMVESWAEKTVVWKAAWMAEK
jgi:hypothetical protein